MTVPVNWLIHENIPEDNICKCHGNIIFKDETNFAKPLTI